MKYIKLYEEIEINSSENPRVTYLFTTDEDFYGEEEKGSRISTWTLKAGSNEEAMKMLHTALGGNPDNLHQDKWEREEIYTVEDLFADLDGMNGSWKYIQIEPGDPRFGQIPFGLNRLI